MIGDISCFDWHLVLVLMRIEKLTKFCAVQTAVSLGSLVLARGIRTPLPFPVLVLGAAVFIWASVVLVSWGLFPLRLERLLIFLVQRESH